MTGENNEAYIYNKGLRDFISSVAGGGGLAGQEVWYGPYVIDKDTPGLASDPGAVLFIPRVGDWIYDARVMTSEYFVMPEGGMPRLSIGYWGSSNYDLFGQDTDFGVAQEDGNMDLITPDARFQVPNNAAMRPVQFLTDSPIYIQLIDGSQDLSNPQKPGPVYTQAPTAGRVEFWFKIVSGEILY